MNAKKQEKKGIKIHNNGQNKYHIRSIGVKKKRNVVNVTPGIVRKITKITIIISNISDISTHHSAKMLKMLENRQTLTNAMVVERRERKKKHAGNIYLNCT